MFLWTCLFNNKIRFYFLECDSDLKFLLVYQQKLNWSFNLPMSLISFKLFSSSSGVSKSGYVIHKFSRYYLLFLADASYISLLHGFSGGSRISRRGRGPIGGGVDLRRGCFSAKMYAKMKEFGPIWGVHPARPTRSANVDISLFKKMMDPNDNENYEGNEV